MMILIVDAGNTTITFAAVSEENDSIINRFKVEEDGFQKDAKIIEDIGESLTDDRLSNGRELLDKWCKNIVKALCGKELTCDEKIFSKAVISSVVMEDEKALAHIASRIADEYVFLNKDNCGLDLSKYSANTLGADRMADMIAALDKYGKKLPLIVFDLGTATTCNVLDENGSFLGGIIAPGLMTAANALLSKASKLKEYKVNEPLSIIGNTSQGCIDSGIVYGHALMIEGIIRKVSEKLGKKCVAVMTGGNTEHIRDYIDSPFYYEPDLLLQGLICISKNL
ncbi:MAG: type III pantothenate kinase [Lachnospiraceae bacterium]|nr:type III pantothenate kinase [Lachnospiraceae bacterium]